ncbi:protein FAR1-RELATED SEQUENCE 5-like [Carex rostrata]
MGDAESVFHYCRTKQAQDPNFYYEIFLDKDSRMVNFFWVDSRARLCYERFGDVVVFDTTYKTNKYCMPLALFVGVNNHLQSILFGFALLQDETEESFEWLFRTWLDAMNGKAPITILTDQDKAIGNMVKKVFSTTTHRLCLWHIMKKFPEKYGNLYKKKSPFKKDIKACLYQSITIEEFEREWNAIMTRYNLAGETWLQQIYEIRNFWIPVYNRTVFSAGMSTTQRVESMHSFFDSFVHSGTTLREFIAKYEQALMRRYMDENREHYASKHMHPVPKGRPPIAEHAAIVYTRNIFNKFENEVEESNRFTKKKLEKSGFDYTYLVSHNLDPNQKFRVSINTSSRDASCECHLFEFKGILCRHILAIFQKKDVQQIPHKYILPRWTKEAADDIPVPIMVEKDKSSLMHTMHFHRKANLLLSCLHECDGAYQLIMDAMDKAYEEVSKLKNSTKEVNEVEESGLDAPHIPIADPQVSKTKGRTKVRPEEVSSNGRLKGGFEVGMDLAKKQKRKCGICHELGHYSTTCKKGLDS